MEIDMAASRSLGVLTLDLIAKIGGFEQGMDRAARTADRKGRKSLQPHAKRAKETEEAWANVGTAIGAVFSSIAVGAVFQKVIAETKQAEQEQAQLAAVLKSTGNAAGPQPGAPESDGRRHAAIARRGSWRRQQRASRAAGFHQHCGRQAASRTARPQPTTPRAPVPPSRRLPRSWAAPRCCR